MPHLKRTLSKSLQCTSAFSRPGLRWGLVMGLWGLLWWSGGGAAQAGKCPNLVVLLDKSGSMTESPAGTTAPPGGSKWELAKVALKANLKTHDGQLPIGIRTRQRV